MSKPAPARVVEKLSALGIPAFTIVAGRPVVASQTEDTRSRQNLVSRLKDDPDLAGEILRPYRRLPVPAMWIDRACGTCRGAALRRFAEIVRIALALEFPDTRYDVKVDDRDPEKPEIWFEEAP